MTKGKRDSIGAESLIFTVGHSTRSLEEFVSLLQGHDVSRLVDVRTVPRSRTNPQFNRDTLPESLHRFGISYIHVPELGGLRKTNKDSPNGGWRNLSFRGYADHMMTAEFEVGLSQLIHWLPTERMALMCAEAVPWRCHRSMIADALIVRGIAVEELLSPAKRQPHKLTSFAKVDGTVITYPPYEEEPV
ncbi:MAG: DUF488 family protein [Verrucomicrobiales bacterium]